MYQGRNPQIVRITPLCFLAVLAIILGLVPIALRAARAESVSVSGPQAIWTVTKADDTDDGTCDADCSLREAIAAATPGGLIDFADDYAIYLNSTLDITHSLTVDGGGHAITVSGDTGNDNSPNVRVFYIDASAGVTLTHLSIISGTTTGIGGGVRNWGTLTVLSSTIAGNTAYLGGGIYNYDGTLTVLDSTIVGNTATDAGGGGIASMGTLTVLDTTIAGNTAYLGGGGVHSNGSLTVLNSTIANNTTDASGGGINSLSSAPFVIENSTLSGNRAAWSGGGIHGHSTRIAIHHSTITSNTADYDNNGDGDGGGLSARVTAVITLSHTVVATNFDVGGEMPDCAELDGGTINSLGYNLVGDTTGCDLSAQNTDLLDQDALLDTLADNGGDTWTHALLSGSPAIDAIPVISCTLAMDQRGVPRPQGSACDIGAVEALPTPDLRITKTAAPDPVRVGELLTYTLVVTNQGTLTATGVVVTDSLPPGVTVVSATPSRGTCSESGGVVTCQSANLLSNPGAESGDLSGWDILLNDGDGWGATTHLPHQGSYSFITSHAWNTRYQEIDLLAAGFSAAYLDSAPPVLVGEWFRGCEFDPADPYYLKVELRGADGVPITSWNVGTQGSPATATFDWTEQAHTFGGYGAGLRTLYLEDGGRDVENWAGHYGAQMDDAYAFIDPLTLAPGEALTVSLVTEVQEVSVLTNTAQVALNEADWNPLDNAVTITTTATCADAITVQNDTDSGAGSLRQAIAYVCPGGVIDFAGDYAIYLNSTLDITQSLTTNGGDHAITVSGDTGNDGSPNVRPFTVNASAGVTLTHLSIISGTTSSAGGGILNSGTLTVLDSTIAGNTANSAGGGIFNSGTLRVLNSTIAGNTAAFLGGGIYSSGTLRVLNSTIADNTASQSGGIENFGELTVRDSTISGNTATAAGGGGIYSFSMAPVTIENSTISGNQAKRHSGGIGTDRTHITIHHSTITSNTADYDGSGDWDGGGLLVYGTGIITLSHTIIAGNLDVGGQAPDCAEVSGGTINSLGYNLVGDTTGCDLSAQNTDLLNQDPLLDTLADNGGDTWTHALLSGSPAIDAIPAISCTLAKDQRGVARPHGPACDIGAYEGYPNRIYLPLILADAP